MLLVKLKSLSILHLASNSIPFSKVFGINPELFPDFDISRLNISKFSIDKLLIHWDYNSYGRPLNGSTTYRDSVFGSKVVKRQLEEIGANSTVDMIYIFKSPYQDAFDIGMKIIRRGKMPHYLFIENKAQDTDSRKFDKRDQYQHVRNGIASDLGDNWSYLYATTAVVKSSRPDWGNMAIIGSKDTAEMLGPFWSFYSVIRKAIAKQ
jgi:hypothetical protein